MQQFGAVFGVAVVTAVFNAHGSLATSAAVTSGYRSALAVSAGASVLGALAAVGIRRARPDDTSQQVEFEPVDAVVGELAPIVPR
jgi:hypothetical protein